MKVVSPLPNWRGLCTLAASATLWWCPQARYSSSIWLFSHGNYISSGFILKSDCFKNLPIYLVDCNNYNNKTIGIFSFYQANTCLHLKLISFGMIYRKKIKKQNTFAAFIDFRKAYDYLPRNKLWAKLQHAGLTRQALRICCVNLYVVYFIKMYTVV